MSFAEGKLLVITGGLGSGKTAYAAELAMAHLAKGGTVVSNIFFKVDRVREWLAEQGLEFDSKRLIAVQDDPAVWKSAVVGTEELPAMLICDEAHLKHFSRDWDKTPREQILFNTMIRKMRIIVVYVTQDLDNLDKTFRKMKNERVSCRNARQRKILGLFYFPFNLFVRVPYSCTPSAPDVAQAPEFCLTPFSFGYYESMQLVGDAQAMFGGLAQAESGGLRRIPKPARVCDLLPWAVVCAAALVFLT